MKKILFIINPHSGQSTLEDFEKALDKHIAEHALRGEILEIEKLIPDSPEEMRDTLRKKFLTDPVDVIAVVGGDGTIMEVLPILVDFPTIKLALIPFGTGNLLAANLGIPRDFSGALNLLFTGKPRRIDMAKINDCFFVLIAGVGVVADIMENTPREHKKFLGPFAYLLNGIKTVLMAKRSKFKVITEKKRFTAKGVAVVVSNAASFLGQCLPLTPDANPDDGLLDVCIIKSRSNWDYMSTLMEIIFNDDSKLLKDRNIIRFQAATIRIESSQELSVQADGNVMGTTPVDISILRNKLQVMVPEEEFHKSLKLRRQASELSIRDSLKCYTATAAAEAESGLK